MGKQVMARDPFTYLHYPDTPPSSPTLLTESQPASSASSMCSTEDTLVIKATKHSILDFFNCVTTKQAPIDKDMYVYRKLAHEELLDMAKKYIPSISDLCTSGKLSDWLTKDGRFGRTSYTRVAGVRTRCRALWVMKNEYQDNALQIVFNHRSYQQTVRSSTNWITIGYARKSKSNEPFKTRVALLQKMVKNLHVKSLCEKVFVSPVCTADSPLLKRDLVLTATAVDAVNELRHNDGDFQDLIMFAKATNLSIRLVVLDYAGLSSNPADLREFTKYEKRHVHSKSSRSNKS
ncbi:hypothetical protein DM01DRAFT_317890 [Hesseltinella vesiculosa]|uniref:Uncharacterized protein n=1 Tax=Hesseltinella vesiculosa TaxID=101127 RepID=A0A1X2GMG7_9FUNG|nr:hypothetical protein DM01DRAFT_317890 [Hesseltinella vesiculosa]